MSGEEGDNIPDAEADEALQREIKRVVAQLLALRTEFMLWSAISFVAAAALPICYRPLIQYGKNEEGPVILAMLTAVTITAAIFMLVSGYRLRTAYPMKPVGLVIFLWVLFALTVLFFGV